MKLCGLDSEIKQNEGLTFLRYYLMASQGISITNNKTVNHKNETPLHEFALVRESYRIC